MHSLHTNIFFQADFAIFIFINIFHRFLKSKVTTENLVEQISKEFTQYIFLLFNQNSSFILFFPFCVWNLAICLFKGYPQFLSNKFTIFSSGIVTMPV